MLLRAVKIIKSSSKQRIILKICDFELARYTCPTQPAYSSRVATLWYRAPELLYGMPKYSTKIDMWSVGCIFAEMLTGTVLFQGEKELDQIEKIYSIMGPPDSNWKEIHHYKYYQPLRYKETPKSNFLQAKKELQKIAFHLHKREKHKG